MRALTPVVWLVVALGASGGCQWPQPAREVRLLTGGEPSRGPALLRQHGCVACHAVRSVPAARGRLGPALDGIGGRMYIAGRLENTPQQLTRWIRQARREVPGTAMPSLGVPEQDARDLAAYLYTLR